MRALAVDVQSELLIDVYCGVPGYGIAVPLQRSAVGAAWSFDDTAVKRIETAGDVHDLAIRPGTTTEQPKLLLVSDGPAGFRIYGAGN